MRIKFTLNGELIGFIDTNENLDFPNEAIKDAYETWCRMKILSFLKESYGISPKEIDFEEDL